jgi:hypothetical protein
MANNTFTINEFMNFSELLKALEALESVSYTLMTQQEDSYNSLYNKLFKSLHSALLIAELIDEKTK